jgi:cystathionine gamma-synthase/cystathionine gamma-lyase/cystathionine beta-lyase
MSDDDSRRIETLAVHGGERRPGPEGSLVFPIYQGTVFSVEPGTDYHDLKYIRLNSTPSQAYLHDKLAALEGAEAGLATSSGMAAATSVLLSLMRNGDHLLAGDCLYGGTHDFLTHDAPRLGWTVTFVDTQQPETWKAALTPTTRLFLTESITNPLMRVAPHHEVVAFARAHGLVSVIDNTFASPVNFRPLGIGYDLAFHSATKYLNGHSDLVAGCVVGPADRVGAVRRTVNHYGGSLDPHAGFLLARGLKTLALRIAACNANGLAVARFLAGHSQVSEVNYPGLETHPDHRHAADLLSGFGGMVSMRLQGGTEAVGRFLEKLTLAYVAPSLGGVETLVTQPALTSHAGMSPEDRARLGVTDDLVRLSCGVEHADDLIADLDRALA